MKKKFLVGIGIFMGLLGGCGGKTTAYEAGAENLEQRNYTEAIEWFQDAVAQGDHAVESWRGIGVAWTEQGVYDKAQEAFQTALGLTGKGERAMRKDLYLYLADAQYYQGDYEGCINTCDTLLDSGREKDAYFLRGSAYLHLNDYSRADADFTRVISGSKDYEDYLDVYMAYKSCGLNADGSEYLENALSIHAGNGEDYYHRGRIYYYLEDYEKSEEALKTSAGKNFPAAQIYLGRVYLSMGDTQRAKENYEKCLKEEGLEAEAYDGLAYCALFEQDYDTALAYIQKGLNEKDQEETQALLFNQIVIYEKMADYDKAREKISEYLSRYPADENAIRENYFLETR